MKKNPDPENSRNRLLNVLKVLLYAQARDIAGATSNATFESGTALAWVPVYPKNVAEQFVNSVVPIRELLAAGLLDAQSTRLRPFTLLPRFRPLIGSLVDLPIVSWQDGTTSGREAVRCQALQTRRPVDAPVAIPCTKLTCHQRLAVCKLRNTLESNHLGYWEEVGLMRPWATGQAVAQRLLRRQTAGGLRPRLPLVPPATSPNPRWPGGLGEVVFAQRTGKTRRIQNLKVIVELCIRYVWKPTG